MTGCQRKSCPGIPGGVNERAAGTRNDRIASFLNASGNGELDLSEGSIYGFCRKFAGASNGSIRHLKEMLLTQDVVATDATTVTVNGEQNYIRNFSTGDTVVYHAMDSRSIKALKGLDLRC